MAVSDEQPVRPSDPALLDAFRKQCQHFGHEIALLAWREQAGVNLDDLIDIVKEFGGDDAVR